MKSETATAKGATMSKGDVKLWWDGRRNWAVELVAAVVGGWLIRLPSGMVVGPVAEGKSRLR
jgi:hypothetical protein